jgi:hypothetical protein
VLIVSVDGRADCEAPATKNIEPGFHYVQLASSRRDRRGGLAYVPYAFVAEPCIRYEVYAEYESSLDRSPWQLVINKDPKPLAGCKPKVAKTADSAVAAEATALKSDPPSDPAPPPSATEQAEGPIATPPNVAP